LRTVADLGFEFGPFRLAPAQRLLLRDGTPLRLGSRAFDLLTLLVQRAGDVVASDELLAHVWPNLHVDEGSLRVHIAELRKALGDAGGARYIANVRGRGYRFLAPVSREPSETSPSASRAAPMAMPAAASEAAPSVGSLPVSPSSVIGRAEIIASLAGQLRARRFLTIVGPGGIGKTTVAVAIAEQLAQRYADGVRFVGLGSLGDPALLPAAVMSALGQTPVGAEIMPSLAGSLRDKRLLIVLDNCEHVVEAAAALAEALLRAAPGVALLATSREALRAEGEWVQRLPSLDIPPPSPALSADQAQTYSAVRLFTERATAGHYGFALADDDVASVVEICRRLDGIPLALELVAARVDAYGVKGLAALINDRLMLAAQGRRTAQPRHQTLRATLDWSYDLLAAPEAAVLRRLAVFAGDFPLEAALAVAGDLSAAALTDQLVNLVGKSLIVADLAGDVPHYRLLMTTRLYALEKLRASGEQRDAMRRHADYHCRLFAAADADGETTPQAEALAIYSRHVDDLRAALDWAFSADGDASLGVALTIAVVPMWVQLSALGECRERVERALASLGEGAAAARPRLQLSAALGWALSYGRGRGREASAAWETTLALATALDDRDYRMRALWGLCNDQFNNGGFRRALDYAQSFAALAEQSNAVADLATGERIVATALHYLGDQDGARAHIDRTIARMASVASPQTVRFRFDLRVSAHYFQARILWLQGHADQALRLAERTIEEGRALGHALTFCSVLGQAACPIAFLAGDYDAAARYGSLLTEHTGRYPARLWQLWARCFAGMVQARRGDTAGGVAALRDALQQAGEARFLPRFLLPLGELAAALGANGDTTQGLATVDDTLARCRARDEGWYLPELLRIRGELLMQQAGRASTDAAEGCFTEALDTARRQGARFWSLRSALSLARLKIARRQPDDARRVVADIYGDFTEGFDIADLRTARALLEG
jgi:predicted ATPase/DNA-binding winged helix-turn-helix (wHTH) protein